MHARFERINAIGPFETEVLSFQGSEEAFNRRVVEAVALAAHALLESASHEHRSIGLHLVVPTLVGMHDQACDAIGPREAASSMLETISKTGRLAMRYLFNRVLMCIN